MTVKTPSPSVFENIAMTKHLPHNAIRAFCDLRDKYGDIVSFTANGRFVLLTHPDEIQYVLKDNYANYKKSKGYLEIEHILGKGLVTSHGDFWKRQRRILAPEFTLKTINQSVGTIIQNTQKMIDKLNSESSEYTNVLPYLMRATFLIAGEQFFGKNVDQFAQDVERVLLTAMDIAIRRVYSPFKFPLWLPTPETLKLKNCVNTLDKITYAVIDEYLENPPEKQNTLSRMIKAKDPETGESMTRKQLRDEVITLLLAGHETTSNSLMWTIYLLCKNPEWKEKLYQQINETIGTNDPTLEDLEKMPLLKKVLFEAMRILPAVPVVSRTPVKEDSIKGHKVKPGDNIICPQQVIHNDPRFWENPEVFNPERFEPEEIKKRHNFSFFPFAHGPRRCIGAEFAMLEGQIILCMLLQKFDFTLQPGFEPKKHITITLNSLNGLNIKLNKRISNE